MSGFCLPIGPEGIRQRQGGEDFAGDGHVLIVIGGLAKLLPQFVRVLEALVEQTPVFLHPEHGIPGGAEDGYVFFQQGIVDGQENPTNGINIPLQVWTWHKYHTDWHYMIDPLLLTANQKVWKEFSAEDKKILEECAKDMEKYSKALSRLGFDDGSSLAYLQSIGKVPAVTDPYKTLADKGMNVVKFTPEMIKEFYDATQSVRDKWTKEIGEDLVKAAEADMKAAQ